MSRVLPILFNTEMVQAILAGRKTVTRRLIKPQPTYSPNDGFSWKGSAYGIDFHQTIKGAAYNFRCAAPYRIGDILYVRETWTKGYIETSDSEYSNEAWFEEWTPNFGDYLNALTGYFYRADNESKQLKINWKPSIHMPKEAARIFLKVKDVRVERLQDITEEQAKSEGISEEQAMSWWKPTFSDPDSGGYPEYRLTFAYDLWDSTIKNADIEKYGWNANPWVWVIEFERCEKPEGENE